MILRRIAQHLGQQHWTGVFIELVIVVLGVFIGLQVDNWNQARQERQRVRVLVEDLRADLHDFDGVQQRYDQNVFRELAAFKAARARGEKPVPYFVRIPGSDTPPKFMFQAAMQAGLADLVEPRLMFDLDFYYSERAGVGVKYERYAAFVEDRILPHLDQTADFYDTSGQLKPAYAQNMARLREWVEYNQVLITASECLQQRLKTPQEPGASCRPNYKTMPSWKGSP